MKNTNITELEERVAHLEATLEMMFNACYYQKDALNRSGRVWSFFKNKN